MDTQAGGDAGTNGGGGGDGPQHLNPNAGPFDVYETKYQRSLRNYLTREALPKEEYYRDLSEVVSGTARPTIDDLLQHTFHKKVSFNVLIYM